MREWSRSLTVLAVAFAGTLAITLGLVMLIVQDRVATTAEATQTPAQSIAPDRMPTAVGGSLAVSGARTDTFRLDRASYDVSISPDFERGFARVEYGRFGLLGEDGDVYLEAEPLSVAQIDFDGMAFYPDPDECTITPGTLNATAGIASARLECPNLEDLRGAGTLTLDGGIALPADLLGLRGDLPPSGGQIEVGDRTLAFSDGRMLVMNALTDDTRRIPLFLYGDDDVSSLGFERDPSTAQLYLTYVVIDAELFDIDDDACLVTADGLGLASPITTVQELTIRCDELQLGDHGTVTIDDTLVIDLINESESAAARR